MEKTTQLTVKTLFQKDDVKRRFEEMLGKRAPQFITSVLQIVSQNEMLSKADPISIYNGAAIAATLDLPLNNNLGFAYILPYNNRQPDGSTKVVAQFQLGYKGFIQLAQRSGQFKTISACPIFEGQIKSHNPLTGIEFDFTKKDSEKVIGYAAYFSLINGFEKTLFMTTEELKKHGARFSKTFKHSNGLWNQDFDSMAIKTVIKLLLSKFAPLSIEMQKAIVTDQAVIKDENGEEVEYVDHEEVTQDVKQINDRKEYDRITEAIKNAKSKDELMNLFDEIKDENQQNIFNEKKSSFDK